MSRKFDHGNPNSRESNLAYLELLSQTMRKGEDGPLIWAPEAFTPLEWALLSRYAASPGGEDPPEEDTGFDVGDDPLDL
jgi:hypothetical protein